MEVYYTRKASKQLADFPKLLQKRIAVKMQFFASQNEPLKFAERLTDFREGEFRFRIGDIRVIFDVRESSIFVLKISRRDQAY
jgi:mRNA-degrading endonuclease RelE of RelBE toxin-antitoxin system